MTGGGKVLSMNRKEGHIVVRKYFERRKEVGTDSWGGVIIGLSHPFIHKKTSVAKCEESILISPYIIFQTVLFRFSISLMIDRSCTPRCAVRARTRLRRRCRT